jgi:hypothetical protein
MHGHMNVKLARFYLAFHIQQSLQKNSFDTATAVFNPVQTQTLLSKLDLTVQRVCLHSIYRFCTPSEDGVSHTGTSNLCQYLGFCLYFTSAIFVLCHIIGKKGISERKAASLREFFPGRSLLPPQRICPFIAQCLLRVYVPSCVKSSPIRGLEWPRGFQEVKAPRFHDNGTELW